MNMKRLGNCLKPFAPAISALFVAACAAGSLCVYEPSAIAPELQAAGAENLRVKTEEGKEISSAQKTGSFDLDDGVYKGSGTGFAGTISVAVQIKDKQIVAIDILSSPDDAAFFQRAQAVIKRIIEGQTLEVDTVSGATYSSRGIISAVKNALTGETDSHETGSSISGGGASQGASSTIEQVQDASSYKDGTYYGTGTGFGGLVKVEVVVADGKISNIRIVEHQDGGEYMSSASSLLQAIISSQSTNVDTVSGATYSSVGLIQAVRNALSQAADVSAVDAQESESGIEKSADYTDGTASVGKIPYKEGIYQGTAQGYNGDISVAVVIQSHAIKAILVTDTSDDEQFFGRALRVVTQVLKTQQTNVDTVSGATYSSKGLLDAIRSALEQADRVTNGEHTDFSESTEALRAVLGQAEAIDKSIYTESSLAVLEMRIQDAKELLAYAEQSAPVSESSHAVVMFGNEAERLRRKIGQAKEKLEFAVAGLERISDEHVPHERKYADGDYIVSVPCVPDADGDFEAYELTMKVTVKEDKIVSVSDVSGNGSADNESYIKKAIKGSGKQQGVINQIVNKGVPREIDVVSRATCSSKAIVEGCQKALDEALILPDEGD